MGQTKAPTTITNENGRWCVTIFSAFNGGGKYSAYGGGTAAGMSGIAGTKDALDELRMLPAATMLVGWSGRWWR